VSEALETPPSGGLTPLAVELRSAVALLGSFPALAGADLAVKAGEVVLLRGPNGAGKTTLLRVCAGLIGVSGGSAVVLGADLGTAAGRRTIRRRVGLMGHATSLYDDLTVRQNVEFWAAASRAVEDVIDPALARTGLDGRLSSVKVSALSAGQRRRTAIAVLLCRRPTLWLLDEPHAGLDAAGRDLVNGLVTEAASSGATIMIASHDLNWASTVATRSVSVIGGQVSDVIADV
jgi:heme ABC exporter ATP-binding subunit CcmA